TWASDILRMSCPSKRMTPDSRRRPPGGNRRITAWAVTDLPEPDSPTMQTVSPLFNCRDSSCTAYLRSPPPGNATDRFSIVSRTSASGCLLSVVSMNTSRTRIQGVIQPVTDKVERQHSQEDRDPGDR